MGVGGSIELRLVVGDYWLAGCALGFWTQTQTRPELLLLLLLLTYLVPLC